MFQAVAESLPIAFGIVLATLPLVVVPLTLASRGAIGVLTWFLAGYAAGIFGLGGAVVLAADLFAFMAGDVAPWTVWARLLLGTALLGLAWRQWQNRPRRGEAAAPPAWLGVLDTLTSPRAAGLGFVLVVLNPKNAVLVASGGLAIAAAASAPVAQAIGLIVFTIVSGLGVATPLLLWMALGSSVRAPLNRMREVLVRYDAQILTVVLAALGLVVMLNAWPSSTRSVQADGAVEVPAATDLDHVVVTRQRLREGRVGRQVLHDASYGFVDFGRAAG